MVEKLFSELKRLEQVEAIALGGSRAGENFDVKSDYDIYVYCRSPLPVDTRRIILEKYCSRIELGNSFWEYEDNCVLNDGIDIDILYRDLDEFAEGISRVVDGCEASNCYTTCMWHNLKTCKVMYDRDGRLTALKAKYDRAYPIELKRNIIDRNMKLLRYAMPAYETQIAKAVKRGDTVSINHRVTEFMASYFDIIFAMNEQTHPGEKRLIQLSEQRCAVLPENFRGNIERLFKDMFTDLDAVCNDVAQIVDALEKVLPD